MSKWEYTETEVWRHGGVEISLYHVFGLLAVKNVVMVFAEAREGKAGDNGDAHSIMMRRSVDGGRSFDKDVCICPSEGKRCLSNPVPVYDEETGMVFLFYQECQNGLETKYCGSDNYLMTSEDLGDTWSMPQKINSVWDAMSDVIPLRNGGPGHGIQIKKGPAAGRLMIPFWHRRYGAECPQKERGYCGSVLYSDDHGLTWQTTDYVNQECMTNESRIVETQSGLLRIIRGGSSDPVRYGSFSTDGGVTWSRSTPLPMSPANNCDAGAISLWDKEGYEDMVLVSRLAEKERRWNIEILISYDGGNTFPDKMAMPVGDAMPGYTDLCIIEEEEPVIDVDNIYGGGKAPAEACLLDAAAAASQTCDQAAEQSGAGLRRLAL